MLRHYQNDELFIITYRFCITDCVYCPSNGLSYKLKRIEERGLSDKRARFNSEQLATTLVKTFLVFNCTRCV